MSTSVLVTGALGNVGAEIVESLLARGAAVRAAGRDVQAIRRRFGDRVDAVCIDLDAPETISPALQGVNRLFLMRPPQVADVERLMFPVVNAAKAAGVEQIVFLSLINIENNRRTPHYKVEQYLRSSGIAWTFLRASFFMQNLSGIHRTELRDRSELFVPVGRGKTSFVDVRDVGAVGAAALVEAGHANCAYDLTGPEALDYYQVAELFSQVLGRTITYRNPSLPRFVWREWRKGRPLVFTLIMAWLYEQTRKGMSAEVTGEVERLLGRPPIALRQFIVDHRAVWM